jgi:DNA-3-methyladenine glycosylase II
MRKNKKSHKLIVLDSHVIEIAEKYLSSVDPILGKIIKSHKPCTICEKEGERDLFEQLCLSIIGQQLSVKVSRIIRERIRNQIEVFTYNSILHTDEETLRANGLSRAKIKYIKPLSTSSVSKKCFLTHLPVCTIFSSLIKYGGFLCVQS